METSVSAVQMAKRRMSNSESNAAKVSVERKFWSESDAAVSAEMTTMDRDLGPGGGRAARARCQKRDVRSETSEEQSTRT